MNINIQDVIRYLGGREAAVPDDMLSLIASRIDECKEVSAPKYVYRIFDVYHLDSGKLSLKNAELALAGKAVAHHLEGAEACVLMAAALGFEIDRRVSLLQRGNMTEAVVLDACASAAIESVCDDACVEIALGLKPNQRLGTRFSPGYGDFPLEAGRSILACLNAEKSIGLYCAQSNLMLPKKSVTAVMGVFGS